MLKPQMPNIPGVGAMTDTLDFVKNLWGSMGVPGMGIPGVTAPSLSVEDLDKKIADLKAVEAWLNVNGTMLRGTIQALEIQRGTIATLKSMGASMAAAITQPGASEKNLFDSVPYASAFFQQTPPAAKPAEKAPPPPPPQEAPAAQAQQASPSADAAAQLANPAVWWNLLQDQFKQAVSTAMAPEPPAKNKDDAAKSAPTPRAKPAAAETAAKAKAPVKAPAKRVAPKGKL